MNRVQKWCWQFRQWQLEPVHYKQLTDKKHVCQNCGLKFAGEYCPRCSQSAKIRESIGWKDISHSILDTFNIEKRSLLRTLWHLIWRPGYLIGDYISGRRQMSYPPLKMLLVVALCLVFGEKLSEWMGWEEAAETVVSNKDGFLEKLGTWAGDNPGWATLALNCMLILPTWHLFRYAPRHPRHTLPEGFFIQVFMATLILMVTIFALISDWLLCLSPIYFVITYCQLFGYGIWETTWRLFVELIEIFIMFIAVVFVVGLLCGVSYFTEKHSYSDVIAVLAFMFAAEAAVVAIAHLINRISYKRRGS